jgi:hypothetical protein
MINLDKKGYRISIGDWVGNLGNHLIQMSGGLNVAKNTQSKLTIPEHRLLRRRTFDFTDVTNDNCFEPLVGRFFYQSDCFQYPIIYDRERKRIFQDHLYKLLLRRSVREHFHDLLTRKPDDLVDPDTLVINMRSGGDIFRTDPPPQNDYMQPPLSFYKHIIESHNYHDCLIVTEADRKNPCIEALMSWNRNIRIKTHTSVRDDLRTILGATHLVMCHSTFSWCLALMSKNLRNLYQPHSFQVRGVGDLSIDTYVFENYIKPGEWKCSPEQLDKMVNHSVDDIRVVHKPYTGNCEHGEAEPSSCW